MLVPMRLGSTALARPPLTSTNGHVFRSQGITMGALTTAAIHYDMDYFSSR